MTEIRRLRRLCVLVVLLTTACATPSPSSSDADATPGATSTSSAALSPSTEPTATPTLAPSPSTSPTASPSPTPEPSPTPFQPAPADQDYTIQAPASVNEAVSFDEVISNPGDMIDHITIADMDAAGSYRVMLGPCAGQGTAFFRWGVLGYENYPCGYALATITGVTTIVISLIAFDGNVSHIAYTLHVSRLP